jgi:hypothetical protein
VVFKNGHYRVFEALRNAGEAGVGTAVMAELIGAKPKSIPPTMAAWRKRAASIGLELRELLEVDRGYAHGQPQTIYRLTPKGMEVFTEKVEKERETAPLSSISNWGR